MSMSDYNRLEPLKKYTANGRNFGIYASAGDVTIKPDFAYTQATSDFKMSLRAQSVRGNGTDGVTIGTSLVADTDYTGIFEVKPPKALFMGTWKPSNEHYSSTVEGCDASYPVTEGIYWRNKNGYNVQMSKNFNSVAPVTDIPLNKMFYYIGGDTTSPYWKCDCYYKDANGKIVFSRTENTYLYNLLNHSEDQLDLMCCTDLPTTTIRAYYFDDDGKWHAYYRPYYGTFFLWETTDGRLQNICRMGDTPIQMCSSLTGSRSSVNLFSVPRQDGTGVVPLRPYFPDGYYPNGIYENDFALMVVSGGTATYYLKMSFLRKTLAYSGMRFLSSYGNNVDFRNNPNTETNFEYKSVSTQLLTPFTPDSFTDCSRSMIGEINDKGLATGRFITQSEFNNYHGKNMDNDYSPNNSGYTPESGGNYDDIDNMPIGRTQTLKGFIDYYGLTSEKLTNLINAQLHAPEGFDITKSFVSLYQIPFNYNRIANFTQAEIFMSGWNTGVTADNLSASVGKIHLGVYNVPAQFNSFLDYEPFSNYSVYVPLCGWIEIPDKIVGNTILVDMVYDVITMTCEAVISCSCDNGNYIIATKVGSLGASQTITSDGTSMRDAAVHQSKLATAGSLIGLGISAASGSPVGMAASGIGVLASLTQGTITSNKNYTSSVGSTTDTSEWALPDSCYIKIVHSIPDAPSEYNHTYGAPCNISDALENFDGYTVIDKPDITISGTTVELNEIKDLLSGGIII